MGIARGHRNLRDGTAHRAGFVLAGRSTLSEGLASLLLSRGESLTSGETKVTGARIAIREKEHVVGFKGVKGVRFAKLPLSQFHIASVGGYPQ